MIRTRLPVDVREGRTVPSGVVFDAPSALAHLSAVAQFIPSDPLRVSPVFALNFGDANSETLPALNGLVRADAHIPGNPVSPVFYGLAHFTSPPT